MPTARLAFVSFQPKGKGFRAFLSLEDFGLDMSDPERKLEKASCLYCEHVLRMRKIVYEIRRFRQGTTPIPARRVWQLGDEIHRLIPKLARLSLQIDGLYDHLVRDLDVKRKWLEKIVILRRYIPSRRMIPASSSWGQFEKGTRKAAERLVLEFMKLNKNGPN
jgi:hypothetical protein